jgi:PEP-CTERM motif
MKQLTSPALNALIALAACATSGTASAVTVIDGLTFSAASFDPLLRPPGFPLAGTHLHSSGGGAALGYPAGKAEVGVFIGEQVRGLSEFDLSRSGLPDGGVVTTPAGSAVLSFRVFNDGGLQPGNDRPFTGAITVEAYGANNSEDVSDWEIPTLGPLYGFGFSTASLAVGQVLTFDVTNSVNAFLSDGGPTAKIGFKLTTNHLTEAAWTFDNFALSIAAPVPEPQTYALLLAGLVSVALAARRRNDLPRAN